MVQIDREGGGGPKKTAANQSVSAHPACHVDRLE